MMLSNPIYFQETKVIMGDKKKQPIPKMVSVHLKQSENYPSLNHALSVLTML